MYYDGEKEEYYVKRFLPESTSKKTSFISDHENSRLAVASTLHHPHVRVKFNKRFKHTRDKEDQILNLREFIAVKGMKALGNRLSPLPITEVLMEPAIEDLEAKVEAEIQAEKAAQNPAPPAAAAAEDFAPEADQISQPIDLELPDSSKKGTPPEEGEQPTLF